MSEVQDKKPAGKKAASKKPAAKPVGAFDGLADMMNAGDLGGLTDNSGQNFSMVAIAEILVKAQVREVFEDAENSLEDLANSIRKHGVSQPIIIRPVPGELPFELVAGERRLRASLMAGLDRIPAMVRELTDEEAEAIQFAENIQRKNLTQIETGRRLQRDLDELGSIEAVMAKHEKSRAWISKWLSILDLPEQTQRLVDENLSADPEVILGIKQIEKVSPEAAKEVVDDLKKNQGESKKGGIARDKVKAAKDKVKPPKKPRKEPENPENVAKPIDRSHEEHGPVTTPTFADVAPETFEALQAQAETADAEQSEYQDEQADIFADAKTEETEAPKASSQAEQNSAPALPPALALNNAFALVSEDGAAPKMVLDCMDSADRENCENWLHSFYDAGSAAKDISRAVIQGFRTGSFAADGHGAFALAAFLYGADSEAKFSMLNIIGSVKA